jgi:hypothetical protein
MTRDELFDYAEKAGLGFIRHTTEKDIEKFENFANVVASAEREKLKGQIETLGAMYELASRQRDELMVQQRADIESVRRKMQ